jgi:hypothetical protein
MLNQPSAAAAGLAAFSECYFLFFVPAGCVINHWPHQGDDSVMNRLTSQDLWRLLQRGGIIIENSIHAATRPGSAFTGIALVCMNHLVSILFRWISNR